MRRSITITNQSTAMAGSCDGCTFSSTSIRLVRLLNTEFRLCSPCVEVVRTGLEIGSIHENVPDKEDDDD